MVSILLYSTVDRYIPVGVLEQPPQKINHRPPAYVGRDDMETMLASRNANDWIKLRLVSFSKLLLKSGIGYYVYYEVVMKSIFFLCSFKNHIYMKSLF